MLILMHHLLCWPARDELKNRVKELEEFYDMAVGRELKMKELKEEIERFRDETAGLKGNKG